MVEPDRSHSGGVASRKSFVRLNPDTSDEEREAQIMDWLEEIMGPPSDGGDHPN